MLGDETVALTSPWAGYRWGPVTVPGDRLDVLPAPAPFDSPRRGARSRSGLVGRPPVARGRGRHGVLRDPALPLRRPAAPDQLAGLAAHRAPARASAPAAEEDTAVLLVVDALADHGRSGGVGGAASSLDVTVRAAAAIAEHHVRRGDRVGLRVRGPRRRDASATAPGRRHLRRILGRLATVRPGDPARR